MNEDEMAVEEELDPQLDAPTSDEEIEDDQNDELAEESEEVPEDATGDEEEEDQDPQPKKSPRMEKRIRQLSGKLAEAKATPAPAQPVTPAATVVTPPAGSSVPDLPPGDYSKEELVEWAMKAAAGNGTSEVAQLREELAQKEAIANVTTKFTTDLGYLESKYAELNEDSPDYDPVLAHEVTEEYEEALLIDPLKADLKKIGERAMRIAQRHAAKSSARTARAVASQKGNGVLKGSGAPKSRADKWTAEAVEKLSIDEYAKNEAAIKRDLYGF